MLRMKRKKNRNEKANNNTMYAYYLIIADQPLTFMNNVNDLRIPY